MPGRRAARYTGGSCSGIRARRNPLTLNVSKSSVTFSPLKARRRKRSVSADAAVLVLEGQAVPVGHDHLGRGAEAAEEAARCGVGHGGEALGQERRAPGVGGGDGHAEIQLRLPGGGQGEWREPVGAVDLGRPQVGVPELPQPGEPLAVGVQGDPVEGDRDARPGRRDARGRAHALRCSAAPGAASAALGGIRRHSAPIGTVPPSAVRADRGRIVLELGVVKGQGQLGRLLVVAARHGNAPALHPGLHVRGSPSR